MAHTHEFDCKVCGAHLDSRQELDKHNRDNHTSSSGAQSGQSNFGSSSRSSSDTSRDLS
jgi:hypothetical protein